MSKMRRIHGHRRLKDDSVNEKTKQKKDKNGRKEKIA